MWLSNTPRRVRPICQRIEVKGKKDYAVKVVNEKTGKLVYARRVYEPTYLPRVFEEGTYRLEVGEVGGSAVQVFKGLKSSQRKGHSRFKYKFLRAFFSFGERVTYLSPSPS